MSKVFGFDDNPSGSNLIIAFASIDGWNVEDAVVINKDILPKLMTTNYQTYTTTRKSDEHIGREQSLVDKNPEKWAAIKDRSGLPTINTYVSDGQHVIGKYIQNKSGSYRDCSVSLTLGDHGVIHSVETTQSRGQEIVRVVVRLTKVPEFGDKFASRFAQKSTVSKFMDNVDMPFVNVPGHVYDEEYATKIQPLSEMINIIANDEVYDKVMGVMRKHNGRRWLAKGTRVQKNDCIVLNFGEMDDMSVYAADSGTVMSVSEDDTGVISLTMRYTSPSRTFPIGIVVSPNAIPTRMTPSKMQEAFVGFSAAVTGERYSADPFRVFNIDTFKQSLRDSGYNGYGYHKVYNGITGKQLEMDIFIGINNYQVSKHQSKDKFQYRGAVGPVVESTGQPSGSRNKGKAGKSGYMSTTAASSSGVPEIAQEMCKRSDLTTVVVCKNCAIIGDVIHTKCGVCNKSDMVKCKIRTSFIHNMNLLRGAGVDARPILSDPVIWNQLGGIVEGDEESEG